MENMILITPRNSEESSTIKKILKALKIEFVTQSSEKKSDITNPEIMNELDKVIGNQYSEKDYITIKDSSNIWESILSK